MAMFSFSSPGETLFGNCLEVDLQDVKSYVRTGLTKVNPQNKIMWWRCNVYYRTNYKIKSVLFHFGYSYIFLSDWNFKLSWKNADAVW